MKFGFHRISGSGRMGLVFFLIQYAFCMNRKERGEEEERNRADCFSCLLACVAWFEELIIVTFFPFFFFTLFFFFLPDLFCFVVFPPSLSASPYLVRCFRIPPPHALLLSRYSLPV